MKRTYHYRVGAKTVEKSYYYIPVRFILAIIILLLETLAVIGAVVLLCYRVPLLYAAAMLTQFLCVLRIISSDDNPDYKSPWLLVVLLLPVVGFMLYFMFYSRKLKKRFVQRLEALRNHGYCREDREEMQSLKEKSLTAYAQAKMLTRIADTHLFSKTAQQYFPLGEDMHKKLLEDLKMAKKFIYMEYFIIEQGQFWNSILEILKEKAAAGVEVKVIYDDIGCMAILPGFYFRTLRSYGIDAVPFSFLRASADSEFNNRSHRKITVIDGKIGYTGGINLADEYINAIHPFGHWKDTAIRLEGEAVWELTKLFLIDYGINVRNLPQTREDWYPAYQKNGEGFLIPFGDGPRPIYERAVGKSVIQNMLSGAKEYAWMTTPYLIIDNDLCTDLENAALRGVDVRIILPHIPDKKIIFSMSRSFYPRLMAAGVKIYEYEPGFIHAKSYLCDGEIAMIGTINLDYRSLVHHFENGVWMYGCQAVADLKADILQTLDQCIEMKPEMLKTSVFHRVFRSMVRVFAPML